jgi:hypothetical protein
VCLTYRAVWGHYLHFNIPRAIDMSVCTATRTSGSPHRATAAVSACEPVHWETRMAHDDLQEPLHKDPVSMRDRTRS